MADRKLHPETLKHIESNDEKRIEYIMSDKWIDYPLSKNILSDLEDLYNSPKQIRKEGILIYGDSGNGKTALLKKFARLHESGEFKNEDDIIVNIMPVVSILAPSGPDESRLYSSILNEMYVPYRDRDPISRKEYLVNYYCQIRNVKMIIIDEIHNILSGSVARQRTIMNAIKNLNNSLGIPIILAGTKDALIATSVDDQIKSRFRPIQLPRWRLDRDFAGFVVTMEMLLPLRKESNFISSPELIEKIHELSDGLLGEAILLLRKCAIYAIRNKEERITLQLLKNTNFAKLSNRQ